MVRIILLALATAAAVSPGAATAASATIADQAACGTAAAAPVPITKVLTIVLENMDYGTIVGDADAPTFNALGRGCGIATDYHGIQFPSLPNYIALTAGTIPPSIAVDGTNGRDCRPGPTCQSTDPSIFTQIDGGTAPAPALTWRTYAESMPGNCFPRNAAPYAVRHNPATYYPGDAAACAQDDVPSGSPAGGALARDLAAGTLPSYALFIPNLCNDGHDACGGVSRVVEQDATLAAWMPSILASPDYASGHLLVVVTADTSESPANGNRLATVLVNPDIPAGTQAGAPLDHYSLLRLDEQLLGLPPLANAATAADMAAAFNLPLPAPAARRAGRPGSSRPGCPHSRSGLPGNPDRGTAAAARRA
jgi:phosphatidylinositol-3-phosphatase